MTRDPENRRRMISRGNDPEMKIDRFHAPSRIPRSIVRRNRRRLYLRLARTIYIQEVGIFQEYSMAAQAVAV